MNDRLRDTELIKDPNIILIPALVPANAIVAHPALIPLIF